MSGCSDVNEVFPQKVPSLVENAVSEKRAIILTRKKINVKNPDRGPPPDLVSPNVSSAPTLLTNCLYELINSSLC